MPAQGAEFPESQYYYHDGRDRQRVPEHNLRPVVRNNGAGNEPTGSEQQYEDLYVPDVVNPNGTWQPDPPGDRYYLSFN